MSAGVPIAASLTSRPYYSMDGVGRPTTDAPVAARPVRSSSCPERLPRLWCALMGVLPLGAENAFAGGATFAKRPPREPVRNQD